MLCVYDANIQLGKFQVIGVMSYHLLDHGTEVPESYSNSIMQPCLNLEELNVIHIASGPSYMDLFM